MVPEFGPILTIWIPLGVYNFTQIKAFKSFFPLQYIGSHSNLKPFGEEGHEVLSFVIKRDMK